MLGGRGGEGVQPGGDTPAVRNVEDPGWQRLGREVVQGPDADDGEHFGQVIVIRADVAGGESGFGLIGHSALLIRLRRPLPLSWVPERFSAGTPFPMGG